MKKEFYRPLTNSIEDMTELQINIHYEKGGENWLSYKTEKRGIYITFKPVWRHDGGITMNFTGDVKSTGFKVLLKELKRKNERIEEEYVNKIEDRLDEFTQDYENGRFNELVEKVKNL